MELSRLAVSLILISVLSFARAQVDCPAFNVSELGATNMLTQGGLVGAAIAAVSGDPSLPVSVQVHNSNIVCLRSGRTRDTYSGVSVVVDYTCNGASSECTGNRILSQFDFECVTNPVRWAPSVDGSAANIVTTPPDANLSTTLRTDCGVCLSPARSIFATITNNDQHCGSCNSACNVGLMRCFNRLDSGCCNFFVNGTCVGSCPSSQVPNSNFDCVVDCGGLPNITNGMVFYNPQGQDQTLLGATVNYTCNTGYTLSGNSMRTCQADGTWSGSNPTCDIVDCGLLTNPTNGMVETPQGTTFSQEATYTCNSTYTLVGDGTRTCLADGSWSGTDPTCDLQCQNGGTFNAGMGICECPIAFTGIDCSGVMCRPPCQNGGTCDTSNGTCRCPAGYGGSDCSVTCVPPCVDGFCVNGVCMPCPAGYFGVNCTETCSSKVMGCTMCVNGTNNLPNCTQCEAGTTLDPQTNECKSAPITGGCSPGCIGAIIGALLGAALLAAIAAAIIYFLYKHFSTPATQIKTGDTAGLNGVAKDNPLYVDPTTVEEEVGEDAAAAVGDA